MAAARLDVDFVGVEIDEHYLATGVQRVNDELNERGLFESAKRAAGESGGHRGRAGKYRCLALAAVLTCGACGSDSPSAPSQPAPASARGSSFTVSSITDGDTLRFTPALEGTTILRMLHIDAAETDPPGGEQSTNALLQLLPAGTEMRIETEQIRIDPFGRVLGHAIRRDGVDINREQLRTGQAVLFVIWPNVGRFEDYRAAEIEAQAEGRGIWNRRLR